MATNNEEILLRMGLDASSVRTGTNAMLDQQKKAASDYVSFWTKAVETRVAREAAIEEAANAKSLARYAALKRNKAAVDAMWMEEQAAQIAMQRGSGMFGSVEAAAAGTAAGAAGSAAGGAMDSVARRELLVMTRELSSGNYKRFFSSFTIFIQHCGKAAIELAKVGGALAAAGFAAYKFVELGKAMGAAGLARGREVFSGADLAEQSGHLAGSLQDRIANLQDSGHLSAAQAEQLSAMSTKGSDNLRTAQRFVMGVEAKLMQEKADAEKKAGDIAAYNASVAARELADKKAAVEKEKESLQINRELSAVYRDRSKLMSDFYRVDASTPTVGDLAGRGFTSRLNALYGEGGQYDLGKGDGPLGNAARESELAKKQMQWDLTYGNGRWVEGENGQPGHFTGQAELDRQRAIKADNLLGAAGLDTPAQKFEAMKQHLGEINDRIKLLTDKATGDGIKINTD